MYFVGVGASVLRLNPECRNSKIISHTSGNFISGIKWILTESDVGTRPVAIIAVVHLTVVTGDGYNISKPYVQRSRISSHCLVDYRNFGGDTWIPCGVLSVFCPLEPSALVTTSL